MELHIRHDPDRERFHADLGGSEAYLDYHRLGDGALDYAHTFVPEEERGRGIASRLVRHALDYAKENGLRVVPSCPFVKSYVESHLEYREVVA